MAWIGVPFTSDAAFTGYDLSNVDFWNQFITASDYRKKAINPAASTISAISVGDVISRATSINAWRSPPTLIGYAQWVDMDLIVAGSPAADVLMYDGFPSRFNQTFVDKVNGILTAAGCPAMGTAPVAADDGIPWTRHSGDRLSPTVGYGVIQKGDMLRRHVFNEWWAVLQALTAYDINTRGGEAGIMLLDSVERYGATDDSETVSDCETRKSNAESNFDAASTTTGNDWPGCRVTGWKFTGFDYSFSARRRKATRETVAAIGTLTHLDSIISYSTADIDGVSDIFFDYDDNGITEGDIAEVHTDGSPGTGIYTTPFFGNLDNPMSHATGVPCPVEDSSYVRGYVVDDIDIILAFDFPDP